MQRQLPLFGRGDQPGFDAAFARARRVELADGAWVEAAGGESITFALGEGDLLVMGGSCQRTWRHTIPKVAAAGPRISIMFRPVWYRD